MFLVGSHVGQVLVYEFGATSPTYQLDLTPKAGWFEKNLSFTFMDLLSAESLLLISNNGIVSIYRVDGSLLHSTTLHSWFDQTITAVAFHSFYYVFGLVDGELSVVKMEVMHNQIRVLHSSHHKRPSAGWIGKWSKDYTSQNIQVSLNVENGYLLALDETGTGFLFEIETLEQVRTFDTNQLLGKHGKCLNISFWSDFIMLYAETGEIILFDFEMKDRLILSERFGTTVGFEASLSKLLFLSKGKETKLHCLYLSHPKWLIKKFLKDKNMEAAIKLGQQIGLNDDIIETIWREAIENQCNLEVDYLSQMNDKKRLLTICQTCFPDSIRSIRNVVKFGLSLTDHINKCDVEQQVETMLDNFETAPDTVDGLNALDFYFFRREFLNMIELLDTFELLVGEDFFGKHPERIGIEFKKFSERGVLDIALDLAKQAKVASLQLMMSRHGASLIPFRFFILDQLKPFADYELYKAILPSCNALTGVENPYKELPQRKTDWTNDESLEEFAKLIKDSPEDGLEKEKVIFPADQARLREWYSARANFLECELGQPQLALKLLSIAQEKHIGGFENQLVLLKCLDVFLKLGQPNTEFMTSKDLLSMDVNEFIAWNLNSKEDHEFSTFVADIVIPFIGLKNADSQGLWDYIKKKVDSSNHFGWFESLVSRLTDQFELRHSMRTELVQVFLYIIHECDVPLDDPIWERTIQNLKSQRNSQVDDWGTEWGQELEESILDEPPKWLDQITRLENRLLAFLFWFITNH